MHKKFVHKTSTFLCTTCAQNVHFFVHFRAQKMCTIRAQNCALFCAQFVHKKCAQFVHRIGTFVQKKLAKNCAKNLAKCADHITHLLVSPQQSFWGGVRVPRFGISAESGPSGFARRPESAKPGQFCAIFAPILAISGTGVPVCPE